MAQERVIGIDLGTTNSLVAYMEGDRPVVIPGEDGQNLVPSVVALDARDEIVVGNAARRYLIETPERAVYSVKRLMGRGIDDLRDELKLFPFRLAEDLKGGEVLRIKLGEREFTPPEISAFILRQLKRNAERYFGASSTSRPLLLLRMGSTRRRMPPSPSTTSAAGPSISRSSSCMRASSRSLPRTAIRTSAATILTTC
jgi:molecular chaperone DnaK (HSP70)